MMKRANIECTQMTILYVQTEHTWRPLNFRYMQREREREREGEVVKSNMYLIWHERTPLADHRTSLNHHKIGQRTTLCITTWYAKQKYMHAASKPDVVRALDTPKDARRVECRRKHVGYMTSTLHDNGSHESRSICIRVFTISRNSKLNRHRLEMSHSRKYFTRF